MPSRPLALALGLFLFASAARADAPKIGDVRPYGVQRGVATEVTVSGSGLAGNPALVASFPFAGAVKASSDAGNLRIDLTVPESAPLGVYPFRVRTDDGLSNPFLLAVGQVPAVSEIEENSTFEQAQPVPSPVVVEGTCAGTDVDHFKFPGKKGQRIVVDAQCARVGSGVDPQIRLTTAARKFVESADDTPGLLTDARLVAVLPEDGDYVVELSDSKYQGGGRAVYRLLIGEVPVAAEVFPIGGRRGEVVGLELRGGTLAEPKLSVVRLDAPAPDGTFVPKLPVGDGRDVEVSSPLDVSDLPELREPADPAAPPARAAAPVVLNGRIDPAGDEDRFTLAVAPGQALRIRVEASDFGSALDGTMQVLAPDGKTLAAAEDTVTPPATVRGKKRGPNEISPDPSLDFTVPAGISEITLALKDLIGRGGVGYPYRIVVEPITPKFQLDVAESELNVPKGGTAAVNVAVQRQGYNGTVSVSIADPPAGLTMRPLTIPAGQASGVFTVSAAKDASFGPIVLKVVGTGQEPNQPPLVVLGSKTVVYASQGPMPVNSMVQDGLPASTALALPAALESPAEPVEVVHGFGGSIPVKIAREPGADAAFAFASLPLPPNMTVGGAIPEKAAEGAAAINAPIETPLGPSVVVLTAKGKVGDREVTLVAPAVPIVVVPPASVELSAPAIEVKAGTTVEFKGKLLRKPQLTVPVKVQINGLPAGLTAEPVEVAPEVGEFTLKIVAAPEAPEATAAAQVMTTFQVNMKDYPMPPAALAVKVVK